MVGIRLVFFVESCIYRIPNNLHQSQILTLDALVEKFESTPPHPQYDLSLRAQSPVLKAEKLALLPYNQEAIAQRLPAPLLPSRDAVNLTLLQGFAFLLKYPLLRLSLRHIAPRGFHPFYYLHQIASL